jgi:hypothetical protein
MCAIERRLPASRHARSGSPLRHQRCDDGDAAFRRCICSAEPRVGPRIASQRASRDHHATDREKCKQAHAWLRFNVALGRNRDHVDARYFTGHTHYFVFLRSSARDSAGVGGGLGPQKRQGSVASRPLVVVAGCRLIVAGPGWDTLAGTLQPTPTAAIKHTS